MCGSGERREREGVGSGRAEFGWAGLELGVVVSCAVRCVVCRVLCVVCSVRCAVCSVQCEG